MKTYIESVKKCRIYPPSGVELKLSVDGRLVYNICQEYPLGYQDRIVVPMSEELEIEIKVTRCIIE